MTNKTLFTSRFGADSGLRITLDSNFDEHVGILAEKYGLWTVVHDSKEAPFPDRQGFNIAPGRSTEIGLK